LELKAAGENFVEQQQAAMLPGTLMLLRIVQEEAQQEYVDV
jgi:hypothetical protein